MLQNSAGGLAKALRAILAQSLMNGAGPLANHYRATCYEPSAEATLSSKYPIVRYLYIYLNRKPNQSLLRF
jgi:ABC-type phosphate transport system substrate-binding protein